MNNVQEKNEWLRDQFDELCGTELSQIVFSIKNYEQKHLNLVSKEYGRFISQSELFYELIIQLSTAVNYIDKSDYSKIKGLQFF